MNRIGWGAVAAVAGLCGCAQGGKPPVPAAAEAVRREKAADPQAKLREARIKHYKAQGALELHRLESQATRERLTREIAQLTRRMEGNAKSVELKLAERRRGVEDLQDRIADSRINLEQLRQMYKEKELHTATENILIERAERDLARLERNLEHARAQLAYAETYEIPAEQQKLEMELDQKKLELRKHEIRSKPELAEKEEEAAKAERQLKEIEGAKTAP